MNIKTVRTTTVRRRSGAALLIGGLIVAAAAGPASAELGVNRKPHQANAQPTKGASLADAGLNLMLGSHYPTAAASSPSPVANVRFEVALGSRGVAVGAPSTGDPGLGVLFGSTAQEAAWTVIRYSPNPGLSLMFSELYPVK